MANQIEFCRDQIRQTMTECIGVSRAVSFEEAARLAGMNHRTLRAYSTGELMHVERILHALLNIPPFAERYMTQRGYSCAHVGNEEVLCEWGMQAELCKATGDTAEFTKDGVFTEHEQHRFIRDIIQPLVRKAVVFVHSKVRRRATA